MKINEVARQEIEQGAKLVSFLYADGSSNAYRLRKIEPSSTSLFGSIVVDELPSCFTLRTDGGASAILPTGDGGYETVGPVAASVIEGLVRSREENERKLDEERANSERLATMLARTGATLKAVESKRDALARVVESYTLPTAESATSYPQIVAERDDYRSKLDDAEAEIQSVRFTLAERDRALDGAEATIAGLRMSTEIWTEGEAEQNAKIESLKSRVDELLGELHDAQAERDSIRKANDRLRAAIADAVTTLRKAAPVATAWIQ